MNHKIAIFVHQPKCSIQSVNGIVKALAPKYDFKIFTKHEIEDDFFDDVDIVCFPGGFGDSDSFDYLLSQNRLAVSNFLKKGGKYLGICMGAYWCDYDYFNIIPDVRVVQYIKQPNSCTKRPHAKAMEVDWQNEKVKMYFYDGATFVGKDFITYATYPNGNPMAIMKGNIGLIGCHPESQKSWYDSYSWMPKHWHNNTHGRYLLNFVNDLMKQ